MIPSLTWANPLSVSVLMITFLMNIECYNGLSCWHCIAENCAEDPSDNYKASKRQCNDGQMCQKVYFEMYSKLEDKHYESTVRGCSSTCEQRDDFQNCSTLIRESRGCIQRSCCSDTDLCNQTSHLVVSRAVIFVLACLYFVLKVV